MKRVLPDGEVCAAIQALLDNGFLAAWSVDYSGEGGALVYRVAVSRQPVQEFTEAEARGWAAGAWDYRRFADGWPRPYP